VRKVAPRVANVLSEDDEMLLSITEQRSGQPSVIR
jgi:hypothetical protein